MSFLLFSPDGLRLAISHQPSSSESAAASSGADSNHRQPSPVDNLLRTIDSGIESGHDTPLSIPEGNVSHCLSPVLMVGFACGNSTKLDEKLEKKGRENGAVAYGVEEHLTLLHLVAATPDFFNCSESPPDWKGVYQEMCKSYNLHWGSLPRLSTTLHAHLVEMYGAIKKAIRVLSLSF